MELVSVSDYRKKWAKYLAETQTNVDKYKYTANDIIRNALNILDNQGILFPFVD
jgi:hypothetical protein